MVEQTRPWMALRYTDTSTSVAAGNTWQTAIDLSTIERFDRFYGERPIKLFDGANGIQYFRQVPFDKRLEYRDAPETFVYYEAGKMLYLNGTVQFAGTLYIDHIKDSPDIENDEQCEARQQQHDRLGGRRRNNRAADRPVLVLQRAQRVDYRYPEYPCAIRAAEMSSG